MLVDLSNVVSISFALTGVTEHLAGWRMVLKRHWSDLQAYMDPKNMSAHLKYFPAHVRVLFHGTDPEDAAQRLKNAETLLHFLLERKEDDWPYDLLDGLLETGQTPLATTLLEEFQKLDQDGRFFTLPQIQHVRRRIETAAAKRDQEVERDDSSVLTFPTGKQLNRKYIVPNYC